MVMVMRHLEYLGLYGLLALLFLYGGEVAGSVRMSLQLWWNTLIPGMLVPMILIRFLHKRGGFAHLRSVCFNTLFHMDGNAFAYVMCALLLGFPGGSLFLKESWEQGLLDEKGVRRLLACCCFPTPGFVILTLGTGLYQDVWIGWKLYFCVVGGGLLLLAGSHRQAVSAKTAVQQLPSFSRALSDAVAESVRAMGMIGVYLLLFLAIAAAIEGVLPDCLILPFQLIGEFSSALVICASLSVSLRFRFILSAMLLAFGGLCVHLQIFSSLRRCPLSYRTFLKMRILHALSAGLLALFLF